MENITCTDNGTGFTFSAEVGGLTITRTFGYTPYEKVIMVTPDKETVLQNAAAEFKRQCEEMMARLQTTPVDLKGTVLG